ncbi:MAG: crotonase/enoyl-CoA hydratase family protein [Pseudomonadota bacterium]
MDMHVPAAIVEAAQQSYERNLHGDASGDALGNIIGDVGETIEFRFSSQLRASYHKAQRAMWMHWKPAPRACFNPSLLRDLHAYCNFVSTTCTADEYADEAYPLNYTVVASDMPGVFNLGGDLDLFTHHILERDHAGLLEYGRACIEVLYRNYVAYDLPITSISLVQGECLGGGFEAALSSDVIVAERSAHFGFPEILFNLFPGMGAYSFLERRIGQRQAEQLIGSGKIYSADDMMKLGVVDVVAEDGMGRAAVVELMRDRQRSRNGWAALAAARRRVQRLDFSELLDIVEMWVDSALRLNPRDLKLMQRLISRQNSLGDSCTVH